MATDVSYGEASAPPSRPSRSGLWRGLLPFLVLIALALPDLLAPPISPTILRQTQTYAQTVHFVAAGFSPAGLTIDINGPTPFRVVYEFPLYQALVGTLFAAFGASYFWGKFVSLLAALAALCLFQRLVRARWGDELAWRAALLFASCPIALLLASAFQPDALALALALLSLLLLARWRTRPTPGRWAAFLLALLAAAWAKFTLLVPFAPLFVAAILWHDAHWRRPTVREALAAVVLFLVPFAAWNVCREHLMDPAYLAVDRRDFLLGDLHRFLRPGYYVKPAFILGAMVCAGAGLAFLGAGLRRLTGIEWLLLAGVPFYFVLLPTAAEQTYYAYALVPALALFMARGVATLESTASAATRRWLRFACAAAWVAGLAVAVPYTLRRDHVTLAAADAVRAVSGRDDLVFVLNMHDRGVGIGALNPALLTLAQRRGWNVEFTSPDLAALRRQIAARRVAGARWAVVTWFTPNLDPWFTPLRPETFSRQPRFDGKLVDGRAIADALAAEFPVASHGPSFVVLRLP